MLTVQKKSKRITAVLLAVLMLALCAPFAFGTDDAAPDHTHTLIKTEAVAATCTEKGNSAYWTCSGCGKYFSDEAGTTQIEENSWVIAALGHEKADSNGDCPRCHAHIQDAQSSVAEDIKSNVSNYFNEFSDKVPFLIPFLKWFIALFVYVLSI